MTNSETSATMLLENQIAQYDRDGFLVLDQFVSRETLGSLCAAYDEVISGETRINGDRLLGNLTRQVMQPSEQHSIFRDNPAIDRARSIAQQVFNDEPVLAFDMLIYKPPSHPHETPWHQDMAYGGTPYAPAGTQIPLSTIQFWIPLDDVDEENGCMHFIPGYHRKPLLAHTVASGNPDDPGRLLALEDPEEQLPLADAVVARLSAGGATLHSYGTPHYTSPNRSKSRPRRAYILNLASQGSVYDRRSNAQAR